MGLYLTIAVIIDIIAISFLLFSLYGVVAKYSSRAIILSIFFLIFTVKYLFITYFLYANVPIPNYFLYIPDLLILLILIAFMISR